MNYRSTGTNPVETNACLQQAGKRSLNIYDRAMGSIKKPLPVKLVCPALAADERCFESAENALREEFGPVDLTGETWDFDYTDYYRREMGDHLMRRIYSFRNLIDPGRLHEVKLLTNRLEQKITARSGRCADRTVNLDPGYITAAKLVLATTKNNSHRIYLDRGIFAEITLLWRKNGFHPVNTTYPDYRSAEYRNFFALVRTLYIGRVDNERL